MSGEANIGAKSDGIPGPTPPELSQGGTPAPTARTTAPGYESERVVAYLNDPMGVGVWRAYFRFIQETPPTLDGSTSSAHVRIHSTSALNWLLTKEVEWPDEEDEVTRTLHARAIRLCRRLPAASHPDSRTGRSRIKPSSTELARLMRALDASEEPEGGAPGVKPPSLFGGLRVMQADDYMGLVANQSEHLFTIAPEGLQEVIVVSLGPSTIELVKKVFESYAHAAKLRLEARLEKVYAPEELAFLPYFLVMADRVMDLAPFVDRSFRQELRAATTAAFQETPEDSIRTTGLAMEQLLRQVYEQCFREPASGLTLGGELRELAMKAYEILGESAPEQAIVDIHEHRRAVGEAIEAATIPHVKSGLIATQHLLGHAKMTSDRLARLERAAKFAEARSHPLLPKTIYLNAERTVNLRNAASHRTSVRITVHEAAQAVRGLVNLLYWWSQRGKLVDNWDVPLRDVVLQLVDRGPEVELPSI